MTWLASNSLGVGLSMGVGLLGLIFAGCAPSANANREPTTFPAYMPHPGDWRKCDVDTVITYFERSGFWQGAMDELGRRLEESGPSALSAPQGARFTRALRARLQADMHMANHPLWHFAAKHDGDHVADLFRRSPGLLKRGSGLGFECLLEGGRHKLAWEFLEPWLHSLHEGTRCAGLCVIGEHKLAAGADAAYARTKDISWPVRLAALFALDKLDDPRAAKALQRHLPDIRRHGVGWRIIWLPYAMATRLQQEFLRMELAKAISRRRIPGAADVLEAVYLNRWEGLSAARMEAGYSLVKLDRAQGVAATARLLKRAGMPDQYIASKVADYHDLLEVEGVLRRVAETSRHKMSKDAAAQALDSIQEERELRQKGEGKEHAKGKTRPTRRDSHRDRR